VLCSALGNEHDPFSIPLDTYAETMRAMLTVNSQQSKAAVGAMEFAIKNKVRRIPT
jgi:hypothetical protein